MKLGKQIADFFEKMDGQVTTSEQAVEALDAISSCLALYLKNNFREDGHSGLMDSFQQSVLTKIEYMQKSEERKLVAEFIIAVKRK